MTSSAAPERRQDLHRRNLIDVGLRLQRHFGTDYARQYLADVNIPDLTIERVLSSAAPPKPLAPRAPDEPPLPM